MISNYFDTYVTNAIAEISKFGDNKLSYGELNIPNMSKAFKIMKQSSIGKSDADHVCVMLDASTFDVTCSFFCPTNPKEDKAQTINGSEFSANPLIEFLNQVFN